MMIAEITKKMIEYSLGSLHDIDHFLKVHSYAKLIGELENLDKDTLYILEIAALTHDIACPYLREKYGKCEYKMQEELGKELVKEFLKEKVSIDVINRVSFLVGHHHTLTEIDKIDHQILVEADFIVNASEMNLSKDEISDFKNKHFKTKTGIKILESIFS